LNLLRSVFLSCFPKVPQNPKTPKVQHLKNVYNIIRITNLKVSFG